MNPLINQHISTTRALQLNDSSRTSTLRAAIQYCIDTNGRDAPLLDVSDMGLCAMIASVLGARKVTSLESSSGSLPTVAATVAQIGNGLPRPNAGFQILQAQAEHLLSEHILGGAAEIVVAEPYYEILEGWHLQESLNYFYTVRSLKKRGVVSSTALSVPAYANVMVCVVECDQFCTAYGHVGSSTTNIVAGFKHSIVNHFGNRYHEYDVSLPLWQYRYKPLSKPLCVARIPYEGTNPTIEATDGATEFTSTGHAEAVVIWVDYACRTNNTSHQNGTEENFDIISTASSSHRPLIRKLSESVAVNEDDVQAGTKFHCRASFGDNSDGIEDHSFSFHIRRTSS
jgi:protein arginine N-methyltransferase 7